MGFIADNALSAKFAVLMNATLFDFGAPTKEQLEAQIVAQQAFGGGDSADVNAQINAIADLIDLSLGFFAVQPSDQQLYADFFETVTGQPGTADQITFMTSTYPGNVALGLANLIVQYSIVSPFADSISEELNQYVLDVDNDVPGVLGTNPFQAPTNIQIDGAESDTILETIGNGETVGFLSVEDANASETPTFELVDDADKAIFEIINDNELVVKDASLIDADAAAQIVVEVKATDPTGQSITEGIVINVENNIFDNIIALGVGNQVTPGTPGDDTFIGTTNFDSDNTSLDAGDVIIGNGGFDTLQIFNDSDTERADGFSFDGQRVEVQNADTGGYIVELNGAPNVYQLVNSESKGDVSFFDVNSNILTNPEGYVLIENLTDDTTIDFNPLATTGANDTLLVKVDNVTQSPANTEDPDINLTEGDRLGPAMPANIETLIVDAINNDSLIESINGGNINTLQIGLAETQNANLEIQDAVAADNPLLNVIDASGHSADLNINIAQGFFGEDYDGSYTGARGDDRVLLGDALMDGDIGAFDGGAGENTLVLWDDIALPPGNSTAGQFQNFQTVEFALNFRGGVLNANNFSGPDGTNDVQTWDFASGINGPGTPFVQVQQLENNEEHRFIVGPGTEGTIRFDFDFGVGGVDNLFQPINGNGNNDQVTIIDQDAGGTIFVRSNEVDVLTYVKEAGGVDNLILEQDGLGQELDDLDTLILKSNFDGGAILLQDDGSSDADALKVVDGTGLGNTALIMDNTNPDDIDLDPNGAIVQAAGGDDQLRGDSGNDELFGEGGDDTLFGNGGADLLDGGTGADIMTGGGASDNFVIEGGDAFAGPGSIDFITDFNPGFGDEVAFKDANGNYLGIDGNGNTFEDLGFFGGGFGYIDGLLAANSLLQFDAAVGGDDLTYVTWDAVGFNFLGADTDNDNIIDTVAQAAPFGGFLAVDIAPSFDENPIA